MKNNLSNWHFDETSAIFLLYKPILDYLQNGFERVVRFFNKKFDLPL